MLPSPFIYEHTEIYIYIKKYVYVSVYVYVICFFSTIVEIVKHETLILVEI